MFFHEGLAISHSILEFGKKKITSSWRIMLKIKKQHIFKRTDIIFNIIYCNRESTSKILT